MMLMDPYFILIGPIMALTCLSVLGYMYSRESKRSAILKTLKHIGIGLILYSFVRIGASSFPVYGTFLLASREKIIPLQVWFLLGAIFVLSSHILRYFWNKTTVKKSR
jgi:hypothetical protein